MMTTRISATVLASLVLSLAAVRTASAGSVSDPVPLLNGTEKAKLLYSIPYVRSSSTVATCVFCTSTAKSGATINDLVGVELFQYGNPENDLTLGEGVASLSSPGKTTTICTRDPASVDNVTTISVDAEGMLGGAGRIVATTTKLICTAFLVSVAGDPPGFMTILPLYKGSKQKGGM